VERGAVHLSVGVTGFEGEASEARGAFKIRVHAFVRH